MRNEGKWLLASFVFISTIIALSIIASVFKLPVLFGIVVGLLLGFVLRKGDLCGSSAISEIVVLKDSSKFWGLWIAILSSAIGFALLDYFGITSMAPKRLIWLSAIIGGLIFGVGTVLGGGCVSGCLYKSASGNLNSIMALIMIPIGVAIVEYGPLNGLNKYLLGFELKSSDGSVLTLHSILGLPYWFLVIIIALLSMIVSLWFSKKKKDNKLKARKDFSFKRIMVNSWKPWHSGIAIGIIGVIAWLSSLEIGRNYPLGITHGVSNIYQTITDKNVKLIHYNPVNTTSMIKPKMPTSQTTQKTSSVFLMLLVVGLLIGSFFAQIISGNFKIDPKPPSELLVALIGGLLIGIGASIATGCVIGNIVSGVGMLSLGMIVFFISTMFGNISTSFIYLIGIKNLR